MYICSITLIYNEMKRLSILLTASLLVIGACKNSQNNPDTAKTDSVATAVDQPAAVDSTTAVSKESKEGKEGKDNKNNTIKKSVMFFSLFSFGVGSRKAGWHRIFLVLR